MESSEEIVRRFLAAWPGKDVDALMRFFAPDAVYHNVPVKPLRGTEAIRGAFQGFCDFMQSIELELVNVAAKGDVVFTERIDRFRWSGGTLDLPVCGVFEVRDGKIVSFRDYFDLPSWERATGVAL